MTMTEVNRKKPNTKNRFWTHLRSSANIPLTSRICSCILASIHLCSWLNKYFIFFQSAPATLTETWSLVVASFRTLSKCSLIVSTLPRMSVTVKPSFLSHRWYCWIADSSWRERTSPCPASSFFVTFEIIFLNIPAGKWPVLCPDVSPSILSRLYMSSGRRTMTSPPPYVSSRYRGWGLSTHKRLQMPRRNISSYRRINQQMWHNKDKLSWQ